MMRGFPHVLRNVRALDLNRGCVPLALRTPRVWGAAFYFLRLLNHISVINRWTFAGGSARIALFAHIVHAALWSALQFISAVIVLLFFWIDLFVWSLGFLFLVGVVLWEVSPLVVES